MEGLEFLERYSRQLLLKQFTPENQVKLLRSRVFVAGCGALGSLVSEILARTGIGNIIIADYDFVEISNLHRTSLFDEEDAKLNRPKVLACAEKLQK
jgi:Dinucleotide-utilizing enzymes involved in molybdopterin and thiamine biosynthesis family 2